MDKIYNPSLSPIETKFNVCRFNRTLLPSYIITPNGYGDSQYANKYFFAPVYNSSIADPTASVTRFLISFKIYDSKTKIEQWKIDFGDREKAIGTMGPVSTLTSNVASGTSAPLTLNIQDASKFPNTGLILIDQEYLYYSGKSSTTLSITQRAVAGTTATNHYAISGAYSNAMYDSSVQLVSEVLHQYKYGGGDGSNASLNASVTAIDTRGRRHATMQMIYPKPFTLQEYT
jgi:hypothetical protein